MCSEPVTFGGGITMRERLGVDAVRPAGLEGAGGLPGAGNAAFDVGGLIGLFDHGNAINLTGI